MMSNYSEKSNGESYNNRRSSSPGQRQRRRSRSPLSRSRQSRSRSPHYDYHSKRIQHSATSHHRYNSHRSRSRSPPGNSSYYAGMHHRPTLYKSRTEDDLVRLNAPENNVLAIFGLSKRVIEQDLFDLYKHFGCKECKVIMDKHTGFPKGYGFVYFSRVKDAIIARDKTNGKLLFGKPMRVDFSIGERDYSALTPAIATRVIRPRLYSDSRDIRDFRDTRVSHRYIQPPTARDLRMPRDSFNSYYHDQHRAHYLRVGSPMRESSRRDNISPYNDHGYSSRHRGEICERRGRIATPPLPSNGYQRDSMSESYRNHYVSNRSRSRTPEKSRKHHRQSRDFNHDIRIFSNKS